MRTGTKLGAAMLVAAIVAGCGGGVSRRSSVSRRKPTISGTSFPQQLQPTAQARAEKTTYEGWSAFRLTNGLVTAVVVPAIGGRIMEYKLGDHPFLWVNPAELGKLYDPPQTEQERTWHNYGGSKVWPAPQANWEGPPDPLGSNLDSGQWTGEIVASRDQAAEIRMVSPEDKQVTGLQITRQVKLFAGTTKLLVTDTFKNVTDKPITWSIWTVTQVPGSLSTDKYNEESRIYFPLNPSSKHEKGFWRAMEMDQPGGPEQFQVIDEGKLMQVSYHNKLGKIGADSVAGWIAHVDELHDYAFVKRFDVSTVADYPHGGATVEVYTNGGDLSYMEVEVLSPMRTLQPGEESTFAQEWYATKIGGPIRDTTELAAIRESLQLEPTERGLHLSGELGVFAPGTLKVTFVDAAGQPVGAPIPIQVRPEETVVLAHTVEAGSGAEKLTVTLENENGTHLGMVGELPLPGRIAQAH